MNSNGEIRTLDHGESPRNDEIEVPAESGAKLVMMSAKARKEYYKARRACVDDSGAMACAYAAERARLAGTAMNG
jgi:phage terminase large subunit-like protein